MIFDSESEDTSIKGVFSLTLQAVKFDKEKEISNNKRRKFDGYYSKRNAKPINDFPVYLIGQLARDDKCNKTDLPGSELLQEAENVIYSAMNKVGGRVIIVDCIDKLVNFYEKFGYNKFNFIDSRSKKLNTMFKIIDKVIYFS